MSGCHNSFFSVYLFPLGCDFQFIQFFSLRLCRDRQILFPLRHFLVLFLLFCLGLALLASVYYVNPFLLFFLLVFFLPSSPYCDFFFPGVQCKRAI